MSDPRAFDQMLATLFPTPQGEYVSALVDEVLAGTHPFAVIRDDDMLTVVPEKSGAGAVGLPVDRTYVHLSPGLQVGLDSIGVTATITQILSAHSIIVNPIACARYDHFFVQADRAAGAAQLLIELGKNVCGWLPHN